MKRNMALLRFGFAVILFMAIAVGGIRWLWLYRGIRHEIRDESQESRHAEIVGAKPLPKAPLVIEIDKGSRSQCMKIDRAEIDGADIWVYFDNDCRESRGFVEILWKGYAPDGTFVIQEAQYATNASNDMDAGERGEFHVNGIKDDPRIVRVKFSIRSQHDEY